MLQTLHIENIALIDKLDINFATGFHILTGETGAGKSIIIDAVSFVLGGRASRELIRSGAERATVEATFSIDHYPALQQTLAALAIEHTTGDDFILSRTITTGGKSAIRANGCLINLNTLIAITSLLVDVHGQHEHQSLLRPEEHIVFLDTYGGDDVQKSRANVQCLYNEMLRLEKDIAQGFSSIQDRARRMDMLAYQINEIQSAGLRDGEEEELDAQLLLLSNAQQIQSSLENSFDLLAGESGAMTNAATALRQLERISRFHPDYADLYTRMNDAYYALEDISFSLRDQKNSCDFQPELLADTEARISLIQGLKRKYGASVAEILSFLNEAQEELEALTQSEGRKEKLMLALEACRTEYNDAARNLSILRRRFADNLTIELLAQLKDLGMEKAQFLVAMAPSTAPLPSGMDKIEFLLSSNAGEPAKPLHKVASGGELSRIMLAFKTIQFGDIPTIIFDEIDSGISGHVAIAVGQKLLQIAEGHQVLCITHLPQIASMADIHYYVEKKEIDSHTISTVKELDETEQIAELARIMGAEQADIQAHRHATELKQRAKEIKSGKN